MNLISEIGLTYSSGSSSYQPKITKSQEAFQVIIDRWDLSKIELQEEFKVLLLNRANNALGLVPISSGGSSGTVVDLKFIFVGAIKANASSIILIHNHPSGNIKPSQQDINMTRKVSEAGKLLDIHVIDHLIIFKHDFLSFADEGLI